MKHTDPHAFFHSFAAGFFFPSRCAYCGSIPFDAFEAARGVCRGCAERFSPEGANRCRRCGKPLVSEIEICMECREFPEPSHSDARTLFSYSSEAGVLLRNYKFRGERAAAGFFADLIVGAVRELERCGNRLTVVPVPPRPGKMKREGWDQMEEIAKKLESRHNLPVRRCLRRVAVSAQKKLDRAQRLANASGMFVCEQAPPAFAVVIDDVTTTGATLASCSRALKEAGSVYVAVVALCYD